MERLLAQVETLLESENGEVFEVSTREVQGMTLTSWDSVLFDGTAVSQIAYGWTDLDTLVIATGSGPLAQLLPQPYGTLDRSYTFQTAIEPFPVPNEGYFFMNMGSILSFANSFFFPTMAQNSEADPIIRAAMGVVRSLSVSSSTTAQLEQADVFLVLSPAAEKLDFGIEEIQEDALTP